jgi:hypothetical protein
MKNTLFKVIRQGAPIVNFAVILSEHEDIALIDIDLKSKYCEAYSTGLEEDNPTITLMADENSLYLNRKYKRDDATEIWFPRYKGWTIYMAEIHKYTCSICLWKHEMKKEYETIMNRSRK